MTRALIQKAWLETRTRFLAASSVFVLLGVLTVLRAPATIAAHEIFHAERLSYRLYVWLSLWHGYLQTLWIVAVIILALGGLVRERAYGTAAFTLSLPVRRSSVVLSRAVVGAVEAIALALLPPLIVWSTSPLAGYRYSMRDLAAFAMCFIGAGLLFFGLGFLISNLLNGEYLAPGLALGITVALYVATKTRWFKAIDVFSVMAGQPHLKHTSWLPVGMWFVVFVLFVVFSVFATTKRNF